MEIRYIFEKNIAMEFKMTLNAIGTKKSLKISETKCVGAKCWRKKMNVENLKKIPVDKKTSLWEKKFKIPGKMSGKYRISEWKKTRGKLSGGQKISLKIFGIQFKMQRENELKEELK